ncbi:MAG: hypothetical protein JXQ87_08905 [Bacteroidia bacterium]
MKRILLFAALFGALALTSNAQQTYWTSQGEYIFSWSQYTGATGNGSTRTRFSIFPNSELVYNVDSRGILGTYFGISLRNVGLNWGDPEKHKRRSLSFGVPLVFKLGDLENDNFFFFGGEIEAFFHYKKKDWTPEGEKIKSSEWFSDEINILQPSFMVGYSMNKIMFKVKYYMFDFFNPEFADATGRLIYQDIGRSNIFYLGISFRQDMGGNDFDFNDDSDEDDGFDFGLNQKLHKLYMPH